MQTCRTYEINRNGFPEPHVFYWSNALLRKYPDHNGGQEPDRRARPNVLQTSISLNTKQEPTPKGSPSPIKRSFVTLLLYLMVSWAPNPPKPKP